MTPCKTSNQIINERIQEIAMLLHQNKVTERERNELASLVYPKLKYYIWSICKNESDTVEALQWSFKKIFNNIEKFDPSKARFTTWVYSISRNETLFYLHKKNKNPVISVEKVYDSHDNAEFSDFFNFEEDFNSLYNITVSEINNIEDPVLKGIAVDKMIKNDRVKTIAIRYNINENTIKTKLRKIRSDIKTKVIRENPDLKELLNQTFNI